MPRFQIPVEVRLWLGLEWDVPEGACWNWKFARDKKNGYGVMQADGKVKKVHRVMYEVVHGKKLKPSDTILHLCDNPSCANPDHLFCGTHTDNMVDMAVKKRGRFKGLSDSYARFLYEKLKLRFEPTIR